MKAHYIKQPHMITRIEFNNRFGIGYQGRMIMENILDSVIDTQPFTLEEILAGVVDAIETLNDETGYNYQPWQVMMIMQDALERNGDVEKLHQITNGGVISVTPADIVQ